MSEFEPFTSKSSQSSRQIKSKKRVAEHGEVFTAEREVKAMCDLVKPETERIDSRFLEPACGDGNFLAEILKRKLVVVIKKYKKNLLDYEKFSVLAVSSLYGVDIMQDNTEICRNRLFTIWETQYKAVCKKSYHAYVADSVKFILSKNIVCGNALSLRCVDSNGNDTEVPIVFSEWAFITGTKMQRKDYTFDGLLNAQDTNKSNKKQSSPDLFSDEEKLADTPNEEGKFLKQYISDFRRVRENG